MEAIKLILLDPQKQSRHPDIRLNMEVDDVVFALRDQEKLRDLFADL